MANTTTAPHGFEYLSMQSEGESGARRNLAALKRLLSSSSPGGGDTPATLETQPSNQHDISCHGDISIEIEDLINYVDAFHFGSPEPTARCQEPFIASSLHQSLMKPNKKLPPPRSAPPGIQYPFSDRTNGSMLDMEGAKSNLNWKLLKEDNNSPIEGSQHDDGGDQYFDDNTAIHANDQQSDAGSKNQQHPEWEKFQSLVKQVEIALQEAWKERDEAREWAKEVRRSTNAWVEEQRSLIEHERQTLHDDNASADMGLVARMEGLKSTIRDLKASDQHQHDVERRLISIIERMEEQRQLRLATISPSSGKPQHRLVGRLEERRKELRLLPRCAQSPRDLYSAKETAKKALANQLSQASFTTPAPVYGPKKKNFRGATPGSIGLHKCNLHGSNLTSRSRRSENNNRVVTLSDGTQKEIRPDGASTVRFPNGDVKIASVSPPHSVAYYHAKSRVIQVATENSDIFEFPNKQVERHYTDGRKLVRFPDGTKKRFFPSGVVESFPPGGKYIVIEHPDGTNDVKYL